tara:strand:- start:10303 stop:11211 length:909 start_codon:yes stop_codon:yes gene_type:complete
MKFKDIVSTLVIIIIFLFLYSSSALTVKMQEIKDDWPIYRCQPMAMPFASYFGSDPIENFSYCVGNIQKDLMGFFLNPIQYVLGMITELGGFLLERIQFIRKFIDYLRNMVTNVLGDTYGMLVNIIIQFQKLIIKTKDLVMKLMGILMTFMYMLQGAVLTGRSVYNGPIGKTLRTLCFKPETPVKLIDGTRVFMKDVKLGDILENKSEVLGLLQLKGNACNPYYKIWSKELLDWIYVTGEHHVCPINKFGKQRDSRFLKNYIKVQNYWRAEITKEFDEEYVCLITSNHQIKIGEHTFWDWED